jgi:hypothetical protein
MTDGCHNIEVLMTVEGRWGGGVNRVVGEDGRKMD